MAARFFIFLTALFVFSGISYVSWADRIYADSYILVIRDIAEKGDMRAVVCKQGEGGCRLVFSLGSGKNKQSVTVDVSFEAAAACFKFGSAGRYLVADNNPNFCMMQGDRKQVALFQPAASSGEVPGRTSQSPVLRSYGDPIAHIEIALISQADSPGPTDHAL
jgi:hypothetical protein